MKRSYIPWMLCAAWGVVIFTTPSWVWILVAPLILAATIFLNIRTRGMK